LLPSSTEVAVFWLRNTISPPLKLATSILIWRFENSTLISTLGTSMMIWKPAKSSPLKSVMSMRSSRLVAGMAEAEKVVTATAAVEDTGDTRGNQLPLQRLHPLKLLPLR